MPDGDGGADLARPLNRPNPAPQSATSASERIPWKVYTVRKGDTLAAIAKYGIEKDIGYISTGGGAFLEVLEGKTLPAFEILERRAAC